MLGVFRNVHDRLPNEKDIHHLYTYRAREDLFAIDTVLILHLFPTQR